MQDLTLSPLFRRQTTLKGNLYRFIQKHYIFTTLYIFMSSNQQVAFMTGRFTKSLKTLRLFQEKITLISLII